MSTRFDLDTSLSDLGANRYGVRLDPGWWIVRGPNGGYLAAILVRAMKAAIGDPARGLRSLTIHFLRPPAEGPAEVVVEVERTGRSLSTVSARLVQDDAVQALALAAFSKPRESDSLHHAVMPEVPPPEAISPRNANASVPLHAHYDERPAFGHGPWSPERGSEAVTGGWIRLAEPRALDDPLIAAYADAWPPAVFACEGLGSVMGVPTVDLTVHFRTPLPPPGAGPRDWVLAVFRSREARQGFVEEDGEIWSRDGVLLAQSRQLAVVG